MKISSQLANNFDYCSAESLFKTIPSFLRALDGSAMSHTKASAFTGTCRVTDGMPSA
jgi:hypothetical protein